MKLLLFFFNSGFSYEWSVMWLGCDGKEHRGQVEGSRWNKCVNGFEVVANAVAMCQSVAFKIARLRVSSLGCGRGCHEKNTLFLDLFIFSWNGVNFHWAGMCSRVCSSKSVFLDPSHGDLLSYHVSPTKNFQMKHLSGRGFSLTSGMACLESYSRNLPSWSVPRFHAHAVSMLPVQLHFIPFINIFFFSQLYI